jgi:hypothetical protein
MSFWTPQSNYEGMGTLEDAVYYQLSPNDGHSCILGCSTDPKLHTLTALRGKDELAILMIVSGQSFHTFIITTMVELSQPEASDVLELHSPSKPNIMCRIALKILDCIRVEKIVKERFNYHTIVKGSPSVSRIDDLLHIFIEIDFQKLHPSNNHFHPVLPQFFTSWLFYIVMSVKVSIVLEELISRQDILIKVSRQEEQISQLFCIK